MEKIIYKRMAVLPAMVLFAFVYVALLILGLIFILLTFCTEWIAEQVRDAWEDVNAICIYLWWD